MDEKLPFDVEVVLERVREAVRPYPQAAMFALRDEGFTSAFEQLVACILSIRTRDETMIRVARELFAEARTPAELAAMDPDRLDEVIRKVTFHGSKGPQLQRIAREVVEKHGGELPCDEATLLALPGVGPKCAHLVLGVACGQPFIGVDVHVHRVTNRWGYVAERTPERTMGALEAKLPVAWHVEINRILVPFGKHVCTGTLPRCSECPVLAWCRQVGVEEHR